jgi:hypothetical protein
MNNTANNTHQPLTVDEANKLGGAVHDLSVLATKKIFEKDDASRKRALLTYLQDGLLLHAEEFLAAWFTMEQEYKPMLQAQATVMGHVLTIINRRQQIQDAAQQQQQQQQQQRPPVPQGDMTAAEAVAADKAAAAALNSVPPATTGVDSTPDNVVQLVTP